MALALAESMGLLGLSTRKKMPTLRITKLTNVLFVNKISTWRMRNFEDNFDIDQVKEASGVTLANEDVFMATQFGEFIRCCNYSVTKFIFSQRIFLLQPV